MDTKVVVGYQHNPADLGAVYLAVTTKSRPAPEDWLPALRDTIDGRRVVWARFPATGRIHTVWVRDRDGDRATVSVTV